MGTLNTTRYVMVPVAAGTSPMGDFLSPNDLASPEGLNLPLSNALASPDYMSSMMNAEDESKRLEAENTFDSMQTVQEAMLVRKQARDNSISDARVGLIDTDTSDIKKRIEQLDQAS